MFQNLSFCEIIAAGFSTFLSGNTGLGLLRLQRAYSL